MFISVVFGWMVENIFALLSSSLSARLPFYTRTCYVPVIYLQRKRVCLFPLRAGRALNLFRLWAHSESRQFLSISSIRNEFSALTSILAQYGASSSVIVLCVVTRWRYSGRTRASTCCWAARGARCTSATCCCSATTASSPSTTLVSALPHVPDAF